MACAPVFGMIACGRLVQTDFQPVDGTHFVVNVPEADSVNHIVIFLTGSQPLPDDTAAAVYFSWPKPESAPSWIYLGFISNCKPSAVFRLASLNSSAAQQQQAPTPAGLVQSSSHVAQIGVSVEPTCQLSALTASEAAEPSRLPAAVEFVHKMLDNFVNYAASFGVCQAQMTPAPAETFVALSVVHKWHENFRRRLQMNPNFWKK